MVGPAIRVKEGAEVHHDISQVLEPSDLNSREPVAFFRRSPRYYYQSGPARAWYRSDVPVSVRVPAGDYRLNRGQDIHSRRLMVRGRHQQLAIGVCQ